MRFYFLLIFLAVGGLFACGGGTVGTDTGNSGPPAKSTAGLDAAPDFEANLPDEALQTDQQASPDAEHARAFISGGIKIAQTQRENLRDLADSFVSALEGEGIGSITSETQSVSIGTSPFNGNSWTAEFSLDDDSNVQIYFRNDSSGFIEAFYRFSTNDDNRADRGIFVFVNPDLFDSTGTLDSGGTLDSEDPHRLGAMAFDFTDLSQALFMFQEDFYSENVGNFVSFDVHHQCDVSSSTLSCLGTFIDITDQEPTRNLGTSIWFSWGDDEEICLAEVDYDGTVTVGDPHLYPGVESAGYDSEDLGSCTLSTPLWGDHVFTTADLFDRYADTSPVGGTAQNTYFLDGLSTTGWDTLTDSLIDGWLLATGL